MRLLVFGCVVLMGAVLAAPLAWVTHGACRVEGGKLLAGTEGTTAKYPDDNWDFFPPQVTDYAESKAAFTRATLAATVTISPTDVSFPTYDVAFQTRYTDPGLLYYQAGLLVRHGEGRGYRVLFSLLSEDVAIYQEGVGFLAAATFPFEAEKAYQVRVNDFENGLSVTIDGKPVVGVMGVRTPPPPGAVGVMTWNSAATFSGVTAEEGPKVALTPMPHVAAFSFREWHDWWWIFDGTEPIARFLRYDAGVRRNTIGDKAGPYRFFGVSDAKLRPGTVPSTPWKLDWDCSLPGVSRANAKRITKFEAATPRPDLLRVTWELAALKTGAPAGRGVMEVTYNAAEDRYVYDCTSTKILAAPLTEPAIEFSDPWPYFAVGPAVPGGLTWPRRLRHFVYTEPDGTLRKVPLNHHWPMLYAFKPGSPAVFVSPDEVNPAFEMLNTDAGLTGGLCNWGYDLHLMLKFPKEKLPVAKGTALTAHFRVTTVSHAKAQAMLDGAKFLDTFEKAFANLQVPLSTGQVLNRFDPSGWAKGSEPFDAWAFDTLSGDNWDKTTGVDDAYSLRIDKPGVYQARNFGPGGYYGVFPAGAYELRAMVKTQGMTGQGCRLGVVNWPATTEDASKWVAGTADWTPVAARFRGPIVGATLRLTLDGPGTAWIDNLQVVRVEE
jgi:hypothetical protein